MRAWERRTRCQFEARCSGLVDDGLRLGVHIHVHIDIRVHVGVDVDVDVLFALDSSAHKSRRERDANEGKHKQPAVSTINHDGANAHRN